MENDIKSREDVAKGVYDILLKLKDRGVLNDDTCNAPNVSLIEMLGETSDFTALAYTLKIRRNSNPVDAFSEVTGCKKEEVLKWVRS